MEQLSTKLKKETHNTQQMVNDSLRSVRTNIEESMKTLRDGVQFQVDDL